MLTMKVAATKKNALSIALSIRLRCAMLAVDPGQRHSTEEGLAKHRFVDGQVRDCKI